MEKKKNMSYYDDIVSDNEFFKEAKKDELSKDQVLDQNFKKAEKSKKNRKKNIATEKKPFLKSGLLLIIVAVVCLVIINIGPWAYIKCDNDSGDGEIETSIYKDDDKTDISYEEVVKIFETPEVNATVHSNNFVGLGFDDFKDSANFLSYGFIFLIFLGVIFIVFQMLNRSKKFLENSFMIFHTTFSCIVILICFLLLFSLIKFIAVYPLLDYNSSFIASENILMIFPVPIILFIVLLISIKVAFSIIKIYTRKASSRWPKKDEKENPLSFYGS